MGLRSFFAACTGFSNKRDWDPERDLPDLTGKVAIVTGGNTGLGERTALNLHSKNARVYIACRSEERALEAIERITQTSLGRREELIYLPFDLTDLEKIRKAKEVFEGREDRLDILVCNAGVMAWPYKIVNGVEVQFWNHLGHFAFVQHLLPIMTKTARSKPPHESVRIVNLASLGHKLMNKPDFSSIGGGDGEGKEGGGVNQSYGSTWKRYGQAKLANILFTTELQERLKGENIKVNCCHPGNIETELHRGMNASYGKVAQWFIRIQGSFLMKIPEGAKTSTYLAASPEVDEKDYRGSYFTPIATPTKPSKAARDKGLAEQLWRISEEFVNKASH